MVVADALFPLINATAMKIGHTGESNKPQIKCLRLVCNNVKAKIKKHKTPILYNPNDEYANAISI